MTLNDAITRYKEMRTSTKLSQEQMIDAISRLDKLVNINIYATHEGGERDFSGYDPDGDLSLELLVPSPYDDMYIDWLDCQGELLARDYKRYNSAATVYDAKFQKFSADYNRTHMPVQKKRRYF